MQQVIVDTSILIAFFLKTERHHVAVREFFKQNNRTRWIILETVFDETVTWLRAKVSPRDSIEIGEILRQQHTYIRLSDADEVATWEAFCRYSDKFWSDTNCSILAIANRLGVFHVVSLDVHIRRMAGLGIICLP